MKANAHPGPDPPGLGIAMDMSIQLKAANGAICTLSLSFNNEGPAGHLLPLHRRHRHLHRALRRPVQRQDEKIDVSQVDVSMNGIGAAGPQSSSPPSAKGREPNASVAQVLACYDVLHRLEQQLLA